MGKANEDHGTSSVKILAERRFLRTYEKFVYFNWELTKNLFTSKQIFRKFSKIPFWINRYII